MGARALLLLVVVLVSGFSACGDDDGPTDELCVPGMVLPCMLPDGTAGEATCDAVFRVGACSPIAAGTDAGIPPGPMPDIGSSTCPDGWRDTSAPDEPALCHPWPESGRESCTGATAHFPGRPGCDPIGSECPGEAFPPALTGAVYALVGATGGDGTRARPLGTIAEALAALPPEGGTVVVGRGTYEERVTLSSGVALVGACPAETHITPPAAIGVHVVGSDVAVADVTVGPGPMTGIFVASGADALLERVLVRDVANGITLEHEIGTRGPSRVRGARLVVRRAFLGIEQRGGSAIVADDVVLEQIGANAWNLQNAIASVRRASIYETATSDPVRPQVVVGGRGSAFVGAELALERVTRDAVTLTHTDTSAELSDVFVRDVEAGINSLDGGKVTLDRGVIGAFRVSALGLNGESEATISDLTVRVDAATDVEEGRGLEVGLGGRLDLRRTLVRGALGWAVLLDGADAELSGIVIEDTESDRATGLWGRAMQLQLGAQARVHSALLTRSREAAVVSAGVGTTAVVSALSVRETRPADCDASFCPEGAAGSGVVALAAGRLDVHRTWVIGSALCGLQVARGGELDVHDSVITGNAFGACVQVPGYDLERVQDGTRYYDNGTNLSAEDLPVPDPVVSP